MSSEPIQTETSTAEPTLVGCGCGTQADTGETAGEMAGEMASETGEPRRAVAVDPEIKDRNLKRLRRIEGQVRGIQKMIEEERYCADILTQISSIQEALRAVGRELMRNHLKHCASNVLRSGNMQKAEAMCDELVELFYKNTR